MPVDISIVLPTRNEEGLIKKTLTEILSYLKKKRLSYEILVVINGSDDATDIIVKKIAKINSGIVVLTSDTGYGPALRKGLLAAKGRFVIVFNVDFYELKFIDLAEVNLLGKDLIIGSKLAPWAEDTRPLVRKMVSRLFNLCLKLVFGFKGSDTHGIKIMRKSVLDIVYPETHTTSGIFDTELVLRIQMTGYDVADFPVRVEEKRLSRFQNRLWQTPKDFWELYKAIHSKSLKI